MSSTGTYDFDPILAEIIEESSERAGIEPATLGSTHLKSIFRSLKFMLNSEWSTLGIRQWMIQQEQEALTTNQSSFVLPVGAIDCIAAVLRRQDRDTEMNMISRNEYLTIVDKTIVGRPDRFFVDRQATAKTFKFWQASENSSDIIVYDYFRQMQDVGNMRNTVQAPSYAMDAICDGLGARIAAKFNRPRYADLQMVYRGNNPDRPTHDSSLGRLLMEDRERGDIETQVKFEPRTIRR